MLNDFWNVFVLDFTIQCPGMFPFRLIVDFFVMCVL